MGVGYALDDSFAAFDDSVGYEFLGFFIGNLSARLASPSPRGRRVTGGSSPEPRPITIRQGLFTRWDICGHEQ